MRTEINKPDPPPEDRGSELSVFERHPLPTSYFGACLYYRFTSAGSCQVLMEPYAEYQGGCNIKYTLRIPGGTTAESDFSNNNHVGSSRPNFWFALRREIKEEVGVYPDFESGDPLHFLSLTRHPNERGSGIHQKIFVAMPFGQFGSGGDADFGLRGYTIIERSGKFTSKKPRFESIRPPIWLELDMVCGGAVEVSLLPDSSIPHPSTTLKLRILGSHLGVLRKLRVLFQSGLLASNLPNN